MRLCTKGLVILLDSSLLSPKLRLFKRIILILIIIHSTETAPVLDKPDQLCFIVETLCIKCELHRIHKALTKVNGTAHSIENHVFRNIITTGRFSSLIDSVIDHIQMPSLVWPHRFARQNNIGKMTSDMHDTLLLFYNTIEILIEEGQTFEGDLDKPFRDIQSGLRDDVICTIRIILYSYSTQWSLNNRDEKQIHFQINQLSREAPSIQYRVKSVVLARLLKEWISNLASVIRSIEKKFA
ncbi:unnamed protein product [Didymodactylos carnosus]|uniref:Uncharacterized protein n=1 Tax=Didymodactylos carnosus TaxID=1234261 RepID=A0A814VV73_9BILA|nr:unnamed protein product [Didymodactylos carnosus]CAF3954617.1 unnamed protein product [Didymodactylos carnosus]